MDWSHIRRFFIIATIWFWGGCASLLWASENQETSVQDTTAVSKRDDHSFDEKTEQPSAQSAYVAPSSRPQEEKIVVLRALDKITARVKTLRIRLGETAVFGKLHITPLFCRKSKPEDPPEVTVFISISEVIPGKNNTQSIFSGWMFASNPSVSALSHPVYDIWVKSCVTPKIKASPAKGEEPHSQSNKESKSLNFTTPEEQ